MGDDVSIFILKEAEECSFESLKKPAVFFILLEFFFSKLFAPLCLSGCGFPPFFRRAHKKMN